MRTIETLGSKLAQLDFNPVIDVTDLPIKETSGISIISGVDIASVIFPELKFAIINERELSKRRQNPQSQTEAQYTK